MFAVAGVVLATPVGAHSALESSDPAEGAVLATSPREITLNFNEPVSLPTGAVRLLDIDGNTVPTTAARATDAVVVAGVPDALEDGSYVVAWKVMSADSHPVSGAFTFVVGSASTAADGSTAFDVAARAAAGDGAEQALVAVAAALAYGGALLAVGAAAFLIAGPQRDESAPLIVRFIQAAAMVGAVGVTAGVLTEAILLDGRGIAWPTGESLRHEIGSAPGAQFLAVVLGLTLLCAGTSATRVPSKVRRGIVAIGGGATLAAFVLVGHTRTASPVALTMISDVVHLAAAAVWTGGLAALLLHLRSRGNDAAAVARFSRVASVSLAAVAVAGVVLGWRILGSWSALIDTTYGVLLLVKIGLVAVVAAIGGYNHFRLVARVGALADGHDDATATTAATTLLRRTLGAELVVIVAVIGVTGFLTNQSPEASSELTPLEAARQQCLADVAAMASQPGMEGMSHACPGDPPTTTVSPFDPTTASSAGAAADFGDGSAVVDVAPARAGSNQVDVELRDAAGTPLDTAEAPVLEFRLRAKSIGPITKTAERVGPGTYRVTLDLPLAGDWEINVSAVVTDFVQPQAVLTVPIAP